MTVARTIKRVMKFTPHHAQQRYRNTSDVSSVLPSTRDWPVRRPVLKPLGLFLERTSRKDYLKVPDLGVRRFMLRRPISSTFSWPTHIHYRESTAPHHHSSASFEHVSQVPGSPLRRKPRTTTARGSKADGSQLKSYVQN